MFIQHILIFITTTWLQNHDCYKFDNDINGFPILCCDWQVFPSLSSIFKFLARGSNAWPWHITFGNNTLIQNDDF